MEIRICANGHQVPQEDLKACPACGASLASAEWHEVEDVPDVPAAFTSNPEREEFPPVPAVLSGFPAGLVLLVPGFVLGLIGWLAVYASDGRGTAAGGGVVLLALGGILVAIGVIAIGVRIGINDSRRA